MRSSAFRPSFSLLLLPLIGLAPDPVDAQHADRIWAEVHTAAGRTHEGFLRWDRNEVGWDDLLNGSKQIPAEVVEMWQEAIRQGAEVEERSIEFMGYRITWDDDLDSFRMTAEAGIRFGHLDSLHVVADDRVRVFTRAGQAVEMRGGSTDIGTSIREVVVDVPGEDAVELRWEDLDRMTFRSAPAGAQPTSGRIHGTVTDAWGREWTGGIGWDLDEALLDDLLDGEDEDGRDREIPFAQIESIERLGWRGAEVRLRDGAVVELSGTNDVDDGHRGVLVSDPALGLVSIPWGDVEIVRFHAPEAVPGRDRWDGGWRLRGVVELEEGETVRGEIRWDADEAWSWEILDGRIRDTELDVEFAFIARIEKRSSRGASVHLLDGRILELEESNDVDADNRGLFVTTAEGETVYVDWYDVVAVDFERPGEGG